MSTSSQRGHFAVAVESAKVGSGTFTPGSYTWHRLAVVQGDLSPQEMMDAVPQETGGGLFTRTTFKNGAFIGGTLSMEARLQNQLGYLIYGLAGASAATAADPGVTSRITRFYVDPANETSVPWMTVRKYTPDTAGNAGLTEYGVDCRVTAMTLTIPQTGAMKAEVSMVGRRPIAVSGETATGTAVEDGTGIALSVKGSVSLPNLSSYIPAGGAWMGAQIIMANQYTTPQQEMIIGSYHPDDFMVLSRSAMIRMVYKWPDEDLYVAGKYASPSGGQRAWTPTILNSPVTISAASAAVVPTFTNPYKLEFNAPNVDWMMSPPVLVGAGMVQTEFIGTVLQTTDSNPSWRVDMYNAATYSFS